MKTNKDKNPMGTRPILPLILSMSLPAMFSMFVQSMYNIVDSMFVARLGEKALTAVSLAYPVQNLILAVGVGTGVGLGSLISRRLGEGDQNAAGQVAAHGILLGVINGLAFAVLGLTLTTPFFHLFTTDSQVVTLGVQYTTFVTVLSFGSMIHLVSEKILQGTGDMFHPMLFQLVGAVTNLILDPIFIFGYLGIPAMGVLGAAVATVIGQMASLALSLYILFFRPHGFTVSLKGFRFRGEMLRDIYAVGIPTMVMQSVGSLLTTLLNGILISFSGAAVSVLGIYNRVQSFVFMPVFGLGQGLLPIMGYNYGAGNRGRLLSCLGHGLAIGSGIMAVGTGIFLLFPQTLLGIFSSTQEMMAIGTSAFQIMCPTFVLAGFGFVLSTFFQSLGRGGYSLTISVVRQLVVVIPVAWVMGRMGNLAGVWLAMPLADIVSAAVCLLLFYRVYKSHVKGLVPIGERTPEEPVEAVPPAATE